MSRGNCVPRGHPEQVSWRCRQMGSVYHLIYGGLLVPRACHDVFVVPGDVAAQHRRTFFGLRERGEVRGSRVAKSMVLGGREADGCGYEGSPPAEA